MVVWLADRYCFLLFQFLFLVGCSLSATARSLLLACIYGSDIALKNQTTVYFDFRPFSVRTSSSFCAFFFETVVSTRQSITYCTAYIHSIPSLTTTTYINQTTTVYIISLECDLTKVENKNVFFQLPQEKKEELKMAETLLYRRFQRIHIFFIQFYFYVQLNRCVLNSFFSSVS